MIRPASSDGAPQRRGSPYVRALQTASLMAQAASSVGEMPRTMVDERLREKEFRILDRLTHHGIIERYPELASQRAHVG